MSDNQNQSSTEVSQYQEHHLAAIVFLCSIYGLLSLTAVVGNVAIIWIICEYINWLGFEVKCYLRFKSFLVLVCHDGYRSLEKRL